MFGQQKTLKRRDERLHREEIEQNKKKSRDVHAEQLLEQLKSRQDEEDDVEEEDKNKKKRMKDKRNVIVQDTRRHDDHVDNKEYKKEKDEKELLQKKREGTAPYQLVPDEYRKNTPWYMIKKSHQEVGSGYHDKQQEEEEGQEEDDVGLRYDKTLLLSKKEVITSTGKLLKGKDAIEFVDRDLNRKNSYDPMSNFLHKPKESTISSSLIDSSGKLECQHVKSSEVNHSERFRDELLKDEKNYSKKNKKRKKSNQYDDIKAKSTNYEKKSKHKKSRRDKHDVNEDSKRDNKCLDSNLLQSLRQKRLERERDAKVKTELHMSQRI